MITNFIKRLFNHPAPRGNLALLAKYDDGSRVELGSYSGGAHPKGAWSEISLVFVSPDGNEIPRRYRMVEE